MKLKKELLRKVDKAKIKASIERDKLFICEMKRLKEIFGKYYSIYHLPDESYIEKIENHIKYDTISLNCKHKSTETIVHENHHNGDDDYEIKCTKCKFTLHYGRTLPYIY